MCSVTSHGRISITTNMSGDSRKGCGEKSKEQSLIWMLQLLLNCVKFKRFQRTREPFHLADSCKILFRKEGRDMTAIPGPPHAIRILLHLAFGFHRVSRGLESFQRQIALNRLITNQKYYMHIYVHA